MRRTKTIVLQLEPTEYERLEAEAKRQGIPPGHLARFYVSAGLDHERTVDAEQRRRAGLLALEKLAKLRAHLPETSDVDVVELIREGREELDRRLPL